MTDTGAPRRGRPPRTDSADSRDRILTAAREEFSVRGYEKVSVRGTAKAAGVDPALVHRCFGIKGQVLVAAVEAAFAPAMRYVINLEPLASADPERSAERVAPVGQGHLTGP
ncbi:TetR/AcrR family transcriptional regulator [Streptomyces aurantiogriseus]|uniref:HTH tetR-type domain-containing protein n=1 Tax=Streptomyces aurantiogriseus TaxID=66870 RepID=A0A918FMP8_9ACTN|nr:TetR/AcrR family transcriptional regulator [Streptomyces aurantiogriseus]GGR57256.1 hypothetical protein GCM10010251_87600 [Streptomyces aurantiogriseus]